MENQNQLTVTKSDELVALEQKQQLEFAMSPVGRMLKRMEAINQVAKFYAASDFVPASFKGKPENCAIAIEMATRMDMNPVMVMQQMYIVNGKPSISSQLIIAMINNCGQFEPLRFEKNDKTGEDAGVRAYTYRKNDPEHKLEGTWITKKMVKDSHWGAKWQEIPEQMFKYRAAVFWARLNAPEITMGFYTKDEVEEPSFVELKEEKPEADEPTTAGMSLAEEAMAFAQDKKKRNKAETPSEPVIFPETTDTPAEPQKAEEGVRDAKTEASPDTNPKAERTLL